MRIESETISTSCCKCHKKVGATAKAVQCDLCNGWQHSKYSGISTDLYELPKKTKSSAITIICVNCKQRLASLTTNWKPAQASVAAPAAPIIVGAPSNNVLASALSSSFTSVSPSEKGDVTVVRKNLSFSQVLCSPIKTATVIARASSTPLGRNKAPVAVSGPKEALANHKPRRLNEPSRKECLIIVNMPESKSEIAQERLDHDAESLRKCLKSLFTEDDKGIADIRVKALFRLGRRRDADQPPRPLKVVLFCVEEAAAVLSRSYKLKGQQIRILRDLSTEDRLKLKEAIAELRERRDNGEQDLCIQDFRVVRRKPRLRWVSLFTSHCQ